LAATAASSYRDVVIGLKRLGEQEHAVAGVAEELAVDPHVAQPPLIGQGRVRPHQRLDLDGGVTNSQTSVARSG
jgi:hypothetical protein